MLSRRSFLAAAAASVAASAAKQHIPVGLELYSVRDQLKQDLPGTVRAVAKMGYEVVEFFSPYFDWTPDYAKEVRKILDDSGIRCCSTHNGEKSFTPENLPHATELNQILGSKIIIMASAGRVEHIDGWKTVGETLTRAADQLKPVGLGAGFHNHTEFKLLEGKRPMDVLAANSSKDVTLQLDVGPCVEAGSDPVAWINSNPGRVRSMHVKDWAPGPDKGFKVMLGDGVAPWKKIFEAAEKTGGIQYYLIEQEGSTYPAMETAERSLANWKKLHKG
jgi:sugar phosphate isomerase/epimerase